MTFSIEYVKELKNIQMKKEYTLSVFTEHKVGLLHRITVIFPGGKSILKV